MSDPGRRATDALPTGSGQAIGSEWLIGHRWRGRARNGPAPFRRGPDAVGNLDSGGAVRDCSGAEDLLHSQQTLVTDNRNAYEVQDSIGRDSARLGFVSRSGASVRDRGGGRPFMLDSA